MQDELTVTFDEHDFVDAYRPTPRRRGQTRVVFALIAVILALLIWLLVAVPETRRDFTDSPLVAGLSGAVIVLALLVGALLIAAPSLRRRAARNTLRNHPGMADPVHYSFDADSFEARSTYTQARYPWELMWDWRETDRIVLILPTPRNYYVLPKRGVDPALLDRLRGQLSRTRKRAKTAK